MAKINTNIPNVTNRVHNELEGLNDGDYQHLTQLEKDNLEYISNKQDSLLNDGTGQKYPTVDAVNFAIENIDLDQVLENGDTATDKIIILNGSSNNRRSSMTQTGIFNYDFTNDKWSGIVDGMIIGSNNTDPTIKNTVDFTRKPTDLGTAKYTLPVKTGDHTFAMIDDIPNDLPEDIYIATQINSSKLLYKTDTYKEIDLQPFAGSLVITNTNEIVKDKNNLYISGNFSNDNSLQAFVCKLENCQIHNGILTFENSEFKNISNPVHSLQYSNNFIYLATRQTQTSIIKINTSDLTDIRTLTLPITAPYNGFATDLLIYKNKLFTIVCPNYNVTANIIEIDDSLSSYKLLFSIPTDPNYRNIFGPPFLIYNDEIYVAFSGTGFNLSIKVFDFNGNIKRSAANLIVNTNNFSDRSVAHWMGIFNNKLIITTVFGKGVHRIDCNSLILEESLALDSVITDDNTISSDGYLYLNGEKSPTDTTAPVYLYKIKYNNFSNFSIELNPFNNGEGSYGSIGTYPIKQSLNTLPVSATVSGIVNNIALQELGGVDKTVNSLRLGRGNSNDINSVYIGSGYSTTASTGLENTFIGSTIANAITSGGFNTAIGSNSSKALTTGVQNTSIGAYSLNLNTTGSFNIGLGVNSLSKSTALSNNTAIGYATLRDLTSSTGGNTAVGRDSMLSATNASFNTIIGLNTARTATIYNYNTVIGNGGLFSLTTGSNNTTLGNLAGGTITTGSGNVVIGADADSVLPSGHITTGSNNIIVTVNDGLGTGITTGSGNIVIGKTSGLAAGSTNTITIADGAGNTMLSKNTAGEISAPNLTTALIASGVAKTIVTKEYIDNNVITNTVSAATTLSVVSTGKVNYHTFTGTTATYTAPAITGNTTKRVVIINQGTGDITLNSNAGANEIWESGVLMASLLIPKDTTVSLYNNSINWSVLGA